MKNRMDAGRYALVTGASRGIGAVFARALAARSSNLILVARTEDQLDQLAHELSDAFGVGVETIALDLTSSGAVSELCRTIYERGLIVETLINNAGFGSRGEFLKLPVDEQLSCIRLNVAALVELTHRLLPEMVERQRGAVVNVSSTAGFQPMPYAAIYAATKAFVTSFSMALAEEVRPHGITVVTLCPGPTQNDNEGSQSSFPGGRQPAAEVVEAALAQIERHGGLVVPRLINKLMAFSNRLLPIHLSAKAVARAMRH